MLIANARVVAALLFVGVLSRPGSGSADERDCLPPKPDQKTVTYCESVSIGRDPVDTNRFVYTVSFQSKFFAGLTRTRTSKESIFQKDRRAVTDYPGSFVIAVEPFWFGALLAAPLNAVPGSPIRPPRQQQPHQVVLRWRDQAGGVLNEMVLPLEEVIEAWPEHGNPEIWYRATANHVNVPLISAAEVVVLGEDGSALATVRGSL